MEEEKSGELYYATLGCSIKSTREEIQRAVRKLSLLYHSDKTNDPEAPIKFLAIQKAKEVLLDDEKRKAIDDLIKAKLKRKEHDTKKTQELSEGRKRMRDKLEQSLKAANHSHLSSSTTKSTTYTTSSTHTKSKTRNINDTANIEKLRQESIKRMEEEINKQTTINQQNIHNDEYIDNLHTTYHNIHKHAMPGTLKVKWKPSHESHSEDTLYQLLKQYGTIESIKLDTNKGTSAIIIFTSYTSAEACVYAYEGSSEYRVTLLTTPDSGNKKSGKTASVFTHTYTTSSTSASTLADGKGTPVYPLPASVLSDVALLDMMRRASEREKLKAYTSNIDVSLPSYNTSTSTTFSNNTTNIPVHTPATSAVGGETGAVPVKPTPLLSKESDILSRMRQKQLEKIQREQQLLQQQQQVQEQGQTLGQEQGQMQQPSVSS